MASLIGVALSRNTTLTSLNLPDNLIGDEGFGDVTDSLPHNSTLVHLNVRGNRCVSMLASHCCHLSVDWCISMLEQQDHSMGRRHSWWRS